MLVSIIPCTSKQCEGRAKQVRRFFSRVLYWAACLTLLPAWFTPSSAYASPEADLLMTTRILISNVGDTTSVLRMDIPLHNPPEVSYQRIALHTTSVEPTEWHVDSSGVTVAYYVLTLAPGEKIAVDHVYYVDMDPEGDEEPSTDPDERYLQPSPGIESDHPEIAAFAARSVGERQDIKAQAEALFNAVRQRVTYDAASPARNQGALAGYTARTGVCTEYASLLVAMMRSLGIYSRTINGYFIYDKPVQSPTTGEMVSYVRHQWVEYFVPGEGWLPLDPTSGWGFQKPFDPSRYLRQTEVDLPVRGTYQGGKIKIEWVTLIEEV